MKNALRKIKINYRKSGLSPRQLSSRKNNGARINLNTKQLLYCLIIEFFPSVFGLFDDYHDNLRFDLVSPSC